MRYPVAQVFLHQDYYNGVLDRGFLKVNWYTYKGSISTVVQSVVRLTQKSEVLGSILGPSTYFRFSFR